MIPHVMYEKVVAYFGGDTARAYQWFQMPNPMLANRTPMQVLKERKNKLVAKAVKILINRD